MERLRNLWEFLSCAVPPGAITSEPLGASMHVRAGAE